MIGAILILLGVILFGYTLLNVEKYTPEEAKLYGTVSALFIIFGGAFLFFNI